MSGGVIKQEGTVDKIIAFGSFFGSLALEIGSIYVSNLMRSRLLYGNPRREIRLLLRVNSDQLAPPVGNEILENAARKTQKFKQAIQEAKVEEVEMTHFLNKYDRDDPITKEDFEVNQRILLHKAHSGEGMDHPVSYFDNNQALVKSLVENGCPQCRVAYTDKNIGLWKLIEDHIDSRL